MISKSRISRNKETCDSDETNFALDSAKRGKHEENAGWCHKLKGVVPQQNGHWGAQIYANHQRIWLGTFKSLKEAAMAYDRASIKLRSGESHRNFPLNDQIVEECEFQSHYSVESVVSMIRDGTYPSKFATFLRTHQTQGVGVNVKYISLKGEEQFCCTQLFQKELTPSDVGKLNRFVIPKKHAITYFPYVCGNAEANDHEMDGGCDDIEVVFYDKLMRVWKFRYCYWKSSQSYVFTRGWNQFVKERKLKAKDIIAFYMCEPMNSSKGGEGQVFSLIDVIYNADQRNQCSEDTKQNLVSCTEVEHEYEETKDLNQKKGLMLFGGLVVESMRRSRRGNGNGEEEVGEGVKRERASENAEQHQNPVTRRIIRSHFLKLKTLINEKRDDLMNTDSDKFDTILSEFHKLHEQVEKPREQVADAEALLDLTRTLVGSVRSLTNEGVTPSHFVTSLLKHYAQGPQNSINWNKLGLAVSPIFLSVHGSSTMLGPMDNELKQRKTGVPRKRAPPPTATSRPQQLDEAVGEEKTDTDKNMSTMFGVLRERKRVRLENLIFNRTSFAQTVENLFALSFLVKDGRAEISLDENRSHYVSPKNAPAAKSVPYSHFVFRFDYQDWKLMKDMVPSGKELMPHRIQCCTAVDSQVEVGSNDSQPAVAVTPIRKLTRNRGLVVQEESVVEESPVCDDENTSRAAAIRRCRRKLH
ncbi:hypothetical protein VNO77_11808 [Canavalia gladiata]|uniref:Non-structural maintenance of chromosomes element 4 n=1 Tax=Canavalia gladiata TaxID=3824 RepID=A0AAN9LZ62_CANGL